MHRRLTRWLLPFCLLASASPLPSLLAGEPGPVVPLNRNMERAVDRVVRSLVRIMVVAESPAGGRLEKQISSGSGAIISKEGHIITNHHVAGRATRIICRLYDGEEVEARLVATDPLTDIAIVQLDLERRKQKGKLSIAVMGNSDRLKVGDAVLAMGCPAGVSQSVTQGIVSNTQLMLPGLGGGEFREEGEAVGSVVRWIGHDAVIFPGNSGGPLVNMRGEIVGINEIALASLGGAIPSNLARDVARQLIERGYVQRSWVGIECQPRLKTSGAERGVLIGGVVPDSPAAQAGLQAGDIMIEFDGTPVDARIPEDLPAINRLLLATPIGKPVKIVTQRGGSNLVGTVQTEPRGRAQGDPVELPDWGIVGRDLTRLAALERRRPDTNGVLVISLGLASPAANAKPPIAAGDILVEVAGKTLTGVQDLWATTESTLKGSRERRSVLVRFDRGKVRYATVVAIGPDPERPAVEPARKSGLSAELQAMSPELAEALGLKGRSGALVTLVYPGHAAERAGLRQGDLLVRLDEDEVRCQRPEDIEDIYGQIRRYRVGRELPIEILRQGTTVKLTLKLEEDLATAEDRQRYRNEAFDLTLEKLTELDRIHQDLPRELRGVRIAQVETGGWAQLAGLRANDIVLAIDGQPVAEVSAARKALEDAAAAKAKRLVLFVRRGVHTSFAEIEPAWTSRLPAQTGLPSPVRPVTITTKEPTQP